MKRMMSKELRIWLNMLLSWEVKNARSFLEQEPVQMLTLISTIQYFTSMLLPVPRYGPFDLWFFVTFIMNIGCLNIVLLQNTNSNKADENRTNEVYFIVNLFPSNTWKSLMMWWIWVLFIFWKAWWCPLIFYFSCKKRLSEIHSKFPWYYYVFST